ncbi:hypothetical protein, partial [Vibrio cincinnatiensis]|uniref:hypothetical protein n=1 Tax=Vibrio cincinnatiensis TaxID=675 RepID=UPI0022AA650B
LVKKIEVFLFMRGHNHFSGRHGRNDSVTEEYGQEAIDSAAQRLRSTNGSRGTTNAWHFYYALVCVITVLCGKLVVALVAP